MNAGKKRLLTVSGLAVLALALVVAVALLWQPGVIRPAVADRQPAVILLDPGHGGEDGGAAAADGTLEKTINLAVALDLRDFFRLWGYPVQMTRDTDVSIYDAGSSGTRQMKVSDMHNRLTLYNQAGLVISIHQNHFSVPKYSGAQVFYSASRPESFALATAVREQLIRQTQPDNTRELKKATDGIFLLHHTTSPAILVECGFLSNPQEREKLKTPEYCQRLACAVFGGYWQYQATAQE